MKKNGYTLMELLSVIVIMGIITAIAVPMYNKLQDSNSKNNFKYYEGIIRQAVSLYEVEYLPKYDASVTCIDIDYQKLIDLEILKEENFSCSGTIRGERKNNGYEYKLYLDCKDEKGKTLITNKTTLPNKSCQK